MRYFARRLVFFFLTLWAAITLNFMIPRMVPGDPAETIVRKIVGQNKPIDPAQVEAMRAMLGTPDGNIFEQYIAYLGNLVRGEFGVSATYFPYTVTHMIWQALPWTIALVGVTQILGFVIGTLLGAWAAWKRNTAFDSTVSLGMTFLGTLPSFGIAMLLIYIFAFKLAWLPMGGGFSETATREFSWEYFQDILRHAMLPALAILIFAPIGWVMGMRNNMIQTLGEDYTRLALAKGLPPRNVALRYSARNAIMPNITGFAISLGGILGGMVFIEGIFNYPGMGRLLNEAIGNRDYALIANDLPVYHHRRAGGEPLRRHDVWLARPARAERSVVIMATQGHKLSSAEAAKQDQLADIGATSSGTAGITSVPGSISANDEVQPLGSGTAAVDITATPETVRDDTGTASTNWRRRLPNWFNVLWDNNKSRLGMILLTGFFLMAIFAPILAPYDPRDSSFMSSMPPSREHWLGTTQAGQDVLSQLIWGARTSLLVGILAGGLATMIGLLIGMVAGYMHGMVDDTLSFLINLALVIPTLPLMIALAAYAPVRGLSLTIIVIGITGWAWAARMNRSQVISLRAREYITSARFAGERPMRIIFREVMPNMMSFVVIGFIGAAMGAIGAEAGLAFLGLGDPTSISWGTMLFWANNGGALLTGQWAWLLAPTLALSLLTLALTMINFGVDALSNPHLREE